MKKYLLPTLLGLLIITGVAKAATTVFKSNQLAPSATNGYILQTDGTNNSWVANSGGGSAFPFTTTGYGVSTSTTVGFTNGFLSTASSTLPNLTHISTTTAGILNITGNGLVYSTPSTLLSTSTPTLSTDFSNTGVLGDSVGGTSGTISLNLGTTHSWTALQKFANASSTLFSAGSAWFGATATSSFATNGTLTIAAGSSGITNLSSATSSWANGLNLTSGCLTYNGGSCVGGSGGGGSGTVNSGTTGQFPYYAGSGTTVTATSTIFITPNGNIGLSSTTPSASLTVVGRPAANSDNAAIFTVASSSVAQPIINATADGRVQFGTSATLPVFFGGNYVFDNNGVNEPYIVKIQSEVNNAHVDITGVFTSDLNFNSTAQIGYNTLNNVFTEQAPIFSFIPTSGQTPLVGIGSTTPVASLSIDNASSTAGTVQSTPFGFVLGMVIKGLEYPVTFFDYYCHQYFSGPTPTVSGGTSSMNSPSNDNDGSINVVGTALTSVTMTFANPWVGTPSCQESDNVLAVGSDITSISSTQVVFGFGTGGVSSATIWYRCSGVK